MKEVERVKKIGYVIDEAIGYFTPDISRINHLFKVYSYIIILLNRPFQSNCNLLQKNGIGFVIYVHIRPKRGVGCNFYYYMLK